MFLFCFVCLFILLIDIMSFQLMLLLYVVMYCSSQHIEKAYLWRTGALCYVKAKIFLPAL